MENFRNITDRELWLSSILLFLIAGVTILYGTGTFGTAVTPDSLSYLSAGEGIARGEGFAGTNEKEFALWPPVLPLILAAFAAVGIDPLAASRFLNALLLAASVLIAFRLQLRVFHSRAFAYLGVALLIFSASLLELHAYLLSEPILILCATAFLYFAYEYSRSASSRSLWLMAILAAIAAVTRYIGVYLICTGAIIIFFSPYKNIATRFMRTVLFSIVATVPLLAWMVRNWIVTDTLTGSRFSADIGAGELLYGIARHLVYLIAGESRLEWAVFLALVVVLIAIFFAKRKEIANSVVPQLDTLLHLFVPALLLIFSYIVLFIVASVGTAIDPPGSRMLAPIQIPIVILALCIVDRLVHAYRSHGGVRLLVQVVVVMFVAILGFRVTASAQMLAEVHSSGAGGFTTKEWHQSETIAYLNTVSTTVDVVSNASEAIIIHTGISAHLSPLKYGYLSPQSTYVDNLNELQDRVRDSEQPIYLVWFNHLHRENLYTLEELKDAFVCHVEREFDDATIYELNAAAATE